MVQGLLVCPCVWVCLCVSEEEDDDGEKMPELVLQMEKREKKRSEMQNINMQSYSNHAYMHSYYSTFVYMHNFANIDVGVFLVKMCKINHFLYFAQFCNL